METKKKLQKQNKKQSMHLGSWSVSVRVLLSLVISSSWLVGCSNIPVADVPIFYELNPNRAYYVYTASTREGEVNNTDKPFYDKEFTPEPLIWDQVKAKSLFIPSFAWADLEAMILKLCEKQKQDCVAHGDPLEKIKRFKQMMYINETFEQTEE